MNYRHAFHAGNPPDVLKHAVLAFILDHLVKKPAPFRVIDTHAGIGLYALKGDQALRTGEWVEGIGRLWGRPIEPALEAFIGPYLDCVARCNPSGRLDLYPGSPEIARLMTRQNDGITLCEKHPDDVAALAARYRRDRRIKVLDLDGWLAPGAFVPPKEKRGLVLIDPPFEEKGEFGRLVDGLAEGHRRFATGIFMLWYPIKDLAEVRAFLNAVVDLGLPKTLSIEMMTHPADGRRLSGSGLILVNAPYTLADAVSTAAGPLLAALGVAGGRLSVRMINA